MKKEFIEGNTQSIRIIKHAFDIMNASDLYILENNPYSFSPHKIIRHLNTIEEGTGAVHFDDIKGYCFIYDIDYTCTVPINDVYLTEGEAKEALNKLIKREA